MLVLTVLALNVFGDGVRDASTRAPRCGWSTRWPASSSAALIAMVLVLFAVSVLTFLIFNVIPNGDPAERMAGRNSTPSQIEAIRKEWGFDKPLSTSST